MKLVADSGSTKTTWFLFADSGIVETSCETSGINPFYQQSSEIVKTLRDEYTMSAEGIDSLYFYGAGAAGEARKNELRTALEAFFEVKNLHIESDLLAAARSLCGTSPGIAAIMGTGSNSCYYDGQQIVHNVSPLGYVLGDEGSGAVLGKKLLSDVLKNQLPEHLIKAFFETYGLSQAEIMDRIYRKPFPNRFMAGFTPFLSAHIHESSLHELVLKSFREFFIRNISQFPQASEYPVHFTGSIARYFSNILKEAAQLQGFTVGNIVQAPMEGLIRYHRSIPL
jgi:glucosamine kinase